VNGHLPMNKPSIVSSQDWEAARQQLLVKEKELTRARDRLAAERRRMPWMAVAKEYEFDGPEGRVSLLDLFDGRRQLIVYRAFFEPGVTAMRLSQGDGANGARSGRRRSLALQDHQKMTPRLHPRACGAWRRPPTVPEGPG
jgi:predicted dithiol-disulfide oxidoreductase (DUF899 family)